MPIVKVPAQNIQVGDTLVNGWKVLRITSFARQHAQKFDGQHRYDRDDESTYMSVRRRRQKECREERVTYREGGATAFTFSFSPGVQTLTMTVGKGEMVEIFRKAA